MTVKFVETHALIQEFLLERKLLVRSKDHHKVVIFHHVEVVA